MIRRARESIIFQPVREGFSSEYAFRARFSHFSLSLTSPSGRKYITGVVKLGISSVGAGIRGVAEKGNTYSSSDIEDMVGLENITMVGYPNGLWDRTNNLPIFRKGVLATDYKHDWNGKKEFLIDAACFPGSSGSPVMLFDVGSYQTRKGNFMGSSRIKLLGVLYAGPQHTVEGEVKVVLVPTRQKAVLVAGIPNNLGIIIKAEQLHAFEGMFR